MFEVNQQKPVKMTTRRSTVMEYLLLASFITSTLCASTAGLRGQTRVGHNNKNENSVFGGEMSVLQKVYDDCQDKQDFTGCLKGKALTAISRAIDMVSSGCSGGDALRKWCEQDQDN